MRQHRADTLSAQHKSRTPGANRYKNLRNKFKRLLQQAARYLDHIIPEELCPCSLTWPQFLWSETAPSLETLLHNLLWQIYDKSSWRKQPAKPHCHLNRVFPKENQQLLGCRHFCLCSYYLCLQNASSLFIKSVRPEKLGLLQDQQQFGSFGSITHFFTSSKKGVLSCDT